MTFQMTIKLCVDLQQFLSAAATLLHLSLISLVGQLTWIHRAFGAA